ncbi:MAG: phosphate ABC transporter substrate-binding protein PstS [Burkholderiales bacterium]|jgi:phosphate transport system substrate-binding protein|nr:phosphate ABC transporter substrate-binding protein PstS [Burkholderiales bacterium]
MNTRILKTWLMATLVTCATVGAVSVAAAQSDVTGAGASFPAPLYTKWSAAYQKETGNRINYQSIGSSAGLKQIDAKTVDFGASDAPLTDEELAQKGLMQFPMAIGGIVPVVNLKDIKPGALKLDGRVLGDIYLGKITVWNDPAIVALNPGLPLPADPIAVVRRADGSGTSFGFTHYLSKVNTEWKDKVGVGTAVNWPVGLGGKGNEGVAAFVGRLNGAIGYVEFAYAKRNGLIYTQMKNREGVFVEPNEASFKAAASGADWKKSFYQILTDQPGKNAWPITSATFIMMHTKQDKPEQAKASLAFFDWAYRKGDAAAIDLDYIPMPQEVKDIVARAWATVTDAKGAALGK